VAELIDAVAVPGLGGSSSIVRAAAQERHPGRVSPGPPLHGSADRENARLKDGRKAAETAMRRRSPRWGVTQRASRPRARELDLTPCTMSRSADRTPWCSSSIWERAGRALAPSIAAPSAASVKKRPPKRVRPRSTPTSAHSRRASRVGPRKIPRKAEGHHTAEGPKRH
jgi:hypothetical protein